MKICFIAPANNYHTKKWTNWFVSRGHEVHIVSFIKDTIPNAKVHFIDTGANADGSDASKVKYLFKARKIKKIVDSIKPDIVNVHYATSYGTAAALSGIKNYVLSVWGSDIYDFPKKSILHKLMLEFSLKRAKWLFSTSKAMAVEGNKYTRKKFIITPFGVDMELFNPNKRTRSASDNKLVIGTIKGLTDKYGISYILKAAAIVRKKTDIQIELRIAGKGPQEQEYKKLAKELNISQEEAAKEWANMDIALVPSTLESESFGVSAVEAQACGTPVIISDIPGLMEATLPNETSIVVKRKNERQLADAIIALYNNREKQKALSERGREFVCSTYELGMCFEKIEKYYYKLIG